MIPFNQEKSSLYFEFAMSSPDEPYTITFIAQTYNEKDKSITIEELQSESKTQHGKTEYHISINSNVLFVFINIKLTNSIKEEVFYVIKAIAITRLASLNEFIVSGNLTERYDKDLHEIDSKWGAIWNNKTSNLYYFVLNDKKINPYSICGQKENKYVSVADKGGMIWKNKQNTYFGYNITVIGFTEDSNGEYLFAYNVEYLEDKLNILLFAIIGAFVLLIGGIAILTIKLYRKVSKKVKKEEEEKPIEVENNSIFM